MISSETLVRPFKLCLTVALNSGRSVNKQPRKSNKAEHCSTGLSSSANVTNEAGEITIKDALAAARIAGSQVFVIRYETSKIPSFRLKINESKNKKNEILPSKIKAERQKKRESNNGSPSSNTVRIAAKCNCRSITTTVRININPSTRNRQRFCLINSTIETDNIRWVPLS